MSLQIRTGICKGNNNNDIDKYNEEKYTYMNCRNHKYNDVIDDKNDKKVLTYLTQTTMSIQLQNSWDDKNGSHTGLIIKAAKMQNRWQLWR